MTKKQKAWTWVVGIIILAFYVEPLLGWVLLAFLAKAFVSWKGFYDPSMKMTRIDE